MTSTVHDREEPSSFKPFTKAERIQQLNDIDKSITQLLQSAGLALKTLSKSQSTDGNALSPEDRRQAFQSASNSYLRTLQSVDVKLRRQIYGLEEADIIPTDNKKGKPKSNGQDPFAGMGSTKPDPKTAGGGSTMGESGMSNLDIGWLNSRSGRVGRDMEAELWAKARAFLEEIGAGISEGAEGGDVVNGMHDRDMEGNTEI